MHAARPHPTPLRALFGVLLPMYFKVRTYVCMVHTGGLHAWRQLAPRVLSKRKCISLCVCAYGCLCTIAVVEEVCVVHMCVHVVVMLRLLLPDVSPDGSVGAASVPTACLWQSRAGRFALHAGPARMAA